MDFKFGISKCSSFQIKSVKSLYKKFYDEKRNKLVLADQVGMGKTYVCKGLIENAPKRVDDMYTVFYVSPNEIITKQNHKELCQGFIDKPTKAVRLSELNPRKEKQKYGFYSFSASMFFSVDNKTLGTEEERLRICRFVYSVFESGKKSEDDEIKKWAIENELYVQMIVSAFFKPKRRYYYFYDNEKPDKETLESFCSEYEKWFDEVCKSETLSDSELKWCICYLKEEVESNIKYVKKINEANKSCCNDLKDIVKSQYKLPENRLNLNYGDEDFSDEKEQEAYTLIKKLLIPYYCYCNDTDEIFYIYFNWYRKFMNKVNFRRMNPDLIILDEFHKYFDEDVKKILDEYVELCPETKILFVSATPYKMSIKSDEFLPDYMKNDIEYNDEDEAEKSKGEKTESNISCFSGYYDLYTYISGKECPELKDALGNIRENIEKLSKIEKKDDFDSLWKDCKAAKETAECFLKKYIIRTERHRLTSGNSNYIEQNGEKCTNEQYIYEAEQFRKINDVLHSPNMALLYTKMAPYPLSFSQGYMSLGADEKSISNKESYEDGVFWDGHTEPEHYRYQALKRLALPDDKIKNLLWIPPSNVSRLSGVWEGSENYTKTLVFARHIMTTKSIAAILSAQINCVNSKDECEDSTFEIDDNDFMISIFNEALKPYCDSDKVGEYTKELSEKFYDYLKNHRNILNNAGVKNKEELKIYCENGCLKETLMEYFYVLTKGRNLTKDDIDIINEALTIQKTSVSYFTEKGEGEVCCSFAEMFNIDCKGADALREILTVKFNSPFYPFVLATTPIAQEGINFQNYCHRILHWRLPVSPIDFEQREGRIDRYRNHAVRKSLAKVKENQTWQEIFNVDETKGGLSPNWIADVDKPIKIESVVINHQLSKEETVHQLLKKAINAYRISLGYGVSKKTLDNIQEIGIKCGKEVNFDEILIDLSPDNKN